MGMIINRLKSRETAMDKLCWETDITREEYNLDNYKYSRNKIFNANFIYANTAGDFPAGWKQGRESKTSGVYWEEDEDQKYSIRIRNKSSNQMASIIQQRSYIVPVHEKQVWEVGAFIKVHNKLNAIIRVYFVYHYNRVSYTSIKFCLEPGCRYYYDLLTIPAAVDYVYLEMGTKEIGTIWFSEVVCKQVFPSSEYNVDSQGRLNINTVEQIKKIIDPVTITGNIEIKRAGRDVFEDVIAASEILTSTVQDVLSFSTYSFCVINRGDYAVGVAIELSPNGIDWLRQSEDNYVEVGQMKILVSDIFLRYIRLAYWTEKNCSSLIRIYFQGQG